MNRNTMMKTLKRSILFMTAIALTMTAGCGTGTGSGASSDDQDKIQTEDQIQDQTDGDTEIVGLTNFNTHDIYGNEVNQDIFKDHQLTLVNVWGTFCGPCLDEMPFLGELQDEYVSKGVNIVGIVVDVQNEDLEINEDQIKLAQEIEDTTGADYPHMIISFDMLQLMHEFDAIPASFFVDSSGNIVSEYYIGAREKADWVDIIEENLEKQQ